MKRAAIHEAGHALVAALHGALDCVSLTPEGEAVAITKGGSDGGPVDVVVGLVGAAACDAVGMRDPAAGAQADICTVVHLVPDGPACSEIYSNLVEFFRRPDVRRALDAAAEALAARGRLSGGEVREMIEAARREAS